jgi:hypothetical protein
MRSKTSSRVATIKYAMVSSEPLGTPPVSPSPQDDDTQESSTVTVDGALRNMLTPLGKGSTGKRKRGAFTVADDDDIVALALMASAVKDIARSSGQQAH